MTRRKRELPNWVQQVVSYEDDVYAWIYLDQADGLLRYEAFVLGYDDAGLPTTLEFVIEEGAFELSQFPEIAPFLPRALRERLEGRTADGCPSESVSSDKGEGASPSRSVSLAWDPTAIRGGDHTPWDMAQWQWEGLHAFCEREERRLKQECRARWTRRLRALGYDVIRSL